MREQVEQLPGETRRDTSPPETQPMLGTEGTTSSLKRPLPERIAERLGETGPGPLAQYLVGWQASALEES